MEQRRLAFILLSVLLLARVSLGTGDVITDFPLRATLSSPATARALTVTLTFIFLGGVLMHILNHRTLARSASLEAVATRRLVRKVNSTSRLPWLHWLCGALLVALGVLVAAQVALWAELQDELTTDPLPKSGWAFVFTCWYFGLRQLAGRHNHWLWPLFAMVLYSDWIGGAADLQQQWLPSDGTAPASGSALLLQMLAFSFILPMWVAASIRRRRPSGSAFLVHTRQHVRVRKLLR